MKTKTMVYFEPAQHRALKSRARAEGISLAELLRRLADAHLAETGARTTVSIEAYRAMAGLGASGQQTVGDEHDVRLAKALRRKHAG